MCLCCPFSFWHSSFFRQSHYNSAVNICFNVSFEFHKVWRFESPLSQSQRTSCRVFSEDICVRSLFFSCSQRSESPDPPAVGACGAGCAASMLPSCDHLGRVFSVRLWLAVSPRLSLPPHHSWLVIGYSRSLHFTQWCFGCSSGKRVSVFGLFCFHPH